MLEIPLAIALTFSQPEFRTDSRLANLKHRIEYLIRLEREKKKEIWDPRYAERENILGITFDATL